MDDDGSQSSYHSVWKIRVYTARLSKSGTSIHMTSSSYCIHVEPFQFEQNVSYPDHAGAGYDLVPHVGGDEDSIWRERGTLRPSE